MGADLNSSGEFHTHHLHSDAHVGGIEGARDTLGSEGSRSSRGSIVKDGHSYSKIKDAGQKVKDGAVCGAKLFGAAILVLTVAAPAWTYRNVKRELSQNFKEFRDARNQGKAALHLERYDSLKAGIDTAKATLDGVRGDVPIDQRMGSFASKSREECIDQKFCTYLSKSLASSPGVGANDAKAFAQNGLKLSQEIRNILKESSTTDEDKQAKIGEIIGHLGEESGLSKEGIEELKQFGPEGLEVCIDYCTKETIPDDQKEKHFKNLEATIEKLINLPSAEGDSKSAKNLKQKHLQLMYQALNNPLYQQYKHDESNPHIAFIHDLCEQFYLESGGNQAMNDFAKNASKIAAKDGSMFSKQVTPFAGVGSTVLRSIKPMFNSAEKYSLDKHKKHEFAAFTALRFGRTITSALSGVSGLTEKHYDSLTGGNDVTPSGTLKSGDQEALHVYTPSMPNPMADALFQRIENRMLRKDDESSDSWASKASNPSMEGENAGMGPVLICTMQNLKKGSEGSRSEATIELGNKYPFSVEVSGWDMDHPVIKGKGEWAMEPLDQEAQPSEAEEAEVTDRLSKIDGEEPVDSDSKLAKVGKSDIKKFQAKVKDLLFQKDDVSGKCSFQKGQVTKGYMDKSGKPFNAGLFFPGLTETDMEEILEATTKIFEAGEEKYAWQDLTGEQKTQAYMNTLASLANYVSLRKSMAKHKKVSMWQMCKQNIDRGAMGNMMMKAMHLAGAIAKTTDLGKVVAIREKQADAMMETTSRVQNVDNRAIMADRAEPYLNTLSLFDLNKDEVAFGQAINDVVNGALGRAGLENREELDYARFETPHKSPSKTEAKA